jgi:hypothetical protein
MSQLTKIAPTAKQKSILMMHLAVFVVVNAVLWFLWSKQPIPADGFKYPVHIWMTSAWALSLIGHWAALYTRYSDKGMEKYRADAATN